MVQEISHKITEKNKLHELKNFFDRPTQRLPEINRDKDDSDYDDEEFKVDGVVKDIQKKPKAKKRKKKQNPHQKLTKVSDNHLIIVWNPQDEQLWDGDTGSERKDSRPR